MSRLRYRLRSLLFLTLVAATCLGVGRFGFMAMATFGLPFCVIEYRFAYPRGPGLLSPRALALRDYVFCIPAATALICLVIDVAVFSFVGLPGDGATLLSMIGVTLWPPAFSTKSGTLQAAVGGCSIALLSTLFVVAHSPAKVGLAAARHLGIDIDARLWLDQSRGRLRLTCWPGLSFEWNGPNTELITATVGKAPEEWCEISWFGGRWSHVNKVYSRSVLTDPHFALALGQLPDDTARVTVLRALTAHRNFKRVHLAMLLMWASDAGVDANASVKQWWAENASLFNVNHDAASAARCVYGWRAAVQRQVGCIVDWRERWPSLSRQIAAAKYFEQGFAIAEFGEEYDALLKSEGAGWDEQRLISVDGGSCLPRF